MGTRNLTMVVSGGETKIAQYGQWDGYPSGQGLTILEFLHSLNGNFDPFREKLKEVRFMTDKDRKDYEEFTKSIGCDNSGWVTMDKMNKINQKFPLLSRDIGGEILQRVFESEGDVWLIDSSSFAGDSLFCEWAYVIDLDKGTLEVYRGFNQGSVEGRFANVEGLDESDGYNTISPYKEFQLSDLPSKEEFLHELKEEE